MATFHLVLLIHAHQPVGNFDSVFEQVYQQSYLPFVEQLERHPAVRLGLHYSGCLLEWLEKHHPEFLVQLRQLVVRRQVEMVGGGYYEPILISIPPQDQTEQLRRMNDISGAPLRRNSDRRLAHRAGLGAAASVRAGLGGADLHAGG